LSKTPTIAIIDDDESFRHAITSFVRSLGYAVRQFESAEAFLKSEYLRDTDCVISDVQMPGMSGIELQSKLIVAPARHFHHCLFGNENACTSTYGRRYLLSCQTIPP